jgi:hypothetical protein
VRPEFEQQRAPIEGANHIPLFSSNHNFLLNPTILLKCLICFSAGGAW